jgi:hypothetical protein
MSHIEAGEFRKNSIKINHRKRMHDRLLCCMLRPCKLRLTQDNYNFQTAPETIKIINIIQDYVNLANLLFYPHKIQKNFFRLLGD